MKGKNLMVIKKKFTLIEHSILKTAKQKES